MRVLHFVAGLDRSEGGPSRSVPRLCSALLSRGVGVTLLYAREPHHLSWEGESAVTAGVALMKMDDPSAATSIESADVVHLHGLWSPQNHSVARRAFAKGKPVVISPRGMLEPWARKHHWFRKAAAWRLYQKRDLVRAALLHATSDDEARHLAQIGFRNSAVVPNGVDVPQQVATFNGERVILFLSRIHPKKGLLLLVEAASRLRAELMAGEWKIVIAGPDEGGHRRQVAGAIAREGLQELFAFAGELEGDAKLTALLRAHLFVLPSYSENFGLVIAEALAAGVPAIATTATPWQDLEEFRCGWRIAPDAAALTETLRLAIATPAATLKEMGQRGRARVQSAYSWDAVAELMTRAYEQVAGRGRITA